MGKNAFSISSFVKSLYAKKGPEPSYPTLPFVSEAGESTVKGLFLVGEVAGTPLVKLGLNEGHETMEQIYGDLKGELGGDSYDVLIVGAGSSGLGAVKRAQELGMRALVLESDRVAMTIEKMYKGKLLFAEPSDVQNKSGMWFEECTREQLLKRWHEQIKEFDLPIHQHEKVTDIQKKDGIFEVTSVKQTYKAKRVVMAVGKAGNPRKAGVPGETDFAEKIHHSISDPDLFSEQNILVYGGGDVACEAAIALSENNHVTMVTIDKEFVYPKKRNSDKIKALAKEGKLDLHMNTWLKEVGEKTVVVEPKGGEKLTLDNDMVLEMIGAELPLKLFKKVGIKLDGTWTATRIAYLVFCFIFVYSLYALKSYGKGASAFPFDLLISPSAYDSGLGTLFGFFFTPFTIAFDDAAIKDMMADRGYQQGFLYSLLYTVLMGVFGYQALVRWRNIASDKKYQTYRFISLIGFQTLFFFLVNIVAVHGLSLKYAWRAWGLYQPFPLFFNVFFWWYEGDPQWIMWGFIGAGILGTLVAIPIASFKHGKRFCTWVCGCGGLAETLGDRWRHLAAKGKRSRAWNFQGTAILLASVLVLAVVVGIYNTDGNNIWWKAYSYIVDFWLVAVIPVALYPFFGGKVWCRYWCPLAAYNGILAKWYGRLRITANDQCISCTQCSKYCQVGVDVMAFAKNQEAFDNRNSNCIHCGICIDVCPMDVLSFNSQARSAFESMGAQSASKVTADHGANVTQVAKRMLPVAQ